MSDQHPDKTALVTALLRMLLPVDRMLVVYDWEDRTDVQAVVDSVRAFGADLSWDQDWPYYEDRIDAALGAVDAVAVYATESAHHSDYVLDLIAKARGLGKPIIEFQRTEQPWTPYGAVVDLRDGYFQRTAGRLAEILQLPRNQSTVLTSSTDPEELLELARRANCCVPLDTMTDRVVFSSEVKGLLERAITYAGGGNRSLRLRATLEHCRALRFHGLWAEARDQLHVAIGLARDTDLYAGYLIELGALEFEMGIIDGIERVRRALDMVRAKVTPVLVKTLRQLGNMLREQGTWKEAHEHLTGAIYLAKILREQAEGCDPTNHNEYVAAHMMWCDCIREYGNLLLHSGRSTEALEQYQFALDQTLEPEFATLCGHLGGVLLYHIGRLHLSTGDVRTAIEHLGKSLSILRHYDNPVRLSFVCDALARARGKLRSPADFEAAEMLFDKAMRVRRRSGHWHMLAYSELGFGDCYRQNKVYDKAIRLYTQAKSEFARLDKKPDRAAASMAVGVAYKYKHDASQDPADLEEARRNLQSAVEGFVEIGLEAKVREAECILLSLGTVAGESLVSLIEMARNQNIELHLDEVGEYRFHSWIRDLCATEHNVPQDARFQVTVDIGDDAAVLKFPMFREYEVVLTTDAAPASLSRLPMRTAQAADKASEVDAAKYVGRFSVVHCLSDVLAMGATPVAVLLNMHLPRETKVTYAMEVVRTVLEEAKKYGAALIGGDIKERGERSIGCVGVGMVRRGHAIRRGGGKPGDVLAITQASNPRTGVPRRIGCRWAQELLEHRRLANEERFRPLLDTSWKRELLFLPRELANIADQYPGLIKAAMDTSDGVMGCLQLMGRESNIHFLLKEAMIEQIIDEKVKMIAAHLGIKPAQFLFNAGHDWEIVLIVERANFERVKQGFQSLRADLAEIGVVKEGYQKAIEFETLSGETRPVPLFTDEKFVLHAAEERVVDWEELGQHLGQ